MPVSSPSYFPGVKGTDQIVGITAGASQTGARVFLAGSKAGAFSTVADLVLIGDNVGGTSAYTDAGMRGTTVIGSSSVPRGGDCTTDILTGNTGAVTSLGWNNAPNIVAGARIAGLIMIGAGILPNAPFDGGGSNWARNILIGNNIGQNNQSTAGFGSSDNVIIGYLAASANAAGNQQLLENTIIGSRACSSLIGTSVTGCVVIGSRAAQGMGGSSNTIIGDQAASTLTTGANNVIVGQGATLNGATAYTVAIGAGQVANVSSKSVYIGGSSGSPPAWGANRNVVIGYNAGANATAGQGDQFIVETNDVSQLSLIYGRFDTGNLWLGNAAVANRGSTGTNNVYLTNGNVGTGSPVGGGYLYVNAGALHYKGSSGTDTVVAVA
jgi:hypothetical protein